MEDLNKNQIVLLTVLISFVTSIATGIMTTSLLQEAPVEVTRNINRIVEKTIETVTTPTTILTEGKKEVTTVIVKEEDLIVDSINKNVKSIVRIEEKDSFANTTSFYGMGLVVSKEGLILADRKTINSANVYTAIMSDDTKIVLSATGVEKQTNFIMFKPVVTEETSKYVYTPATISDVEPKLGQTLIAVGGNTTNTIAIGRALTLNTKDLTVGTTTSKYLSTIDTDLPTKDLLNGSPLFNLSGDVVGIKPSSDAGRIFVSSVVLKREIAQLSEASKTE
jgi:S1-C subfamily serine protease